MLISFVIDWLIDWSTLLIPGNKMLSCVTVRAQKHFLLPILCCFFCLQCPATTPWRRSKWSGSTVLTRASTRTPSSSGPTRLPSSTRPSASGWRARQSERTGVYCWFLSLVFLTMWFHLCSVLDLKMPLTASLVNHCDCDLLQWREFMPKTVGVDPSPFTVRKPEETGKSVLGWVPFTFLLLPFCFLLFCWIKRNF